MKELPRIIVLVPALASYCRGLLRGIARYSRLHGPWSFFNERGEPDEVLPLLKNWNANGIITYFDTSENLHKLLPPDLPAVIVTTNAEIPGYPNVIGDWKNESCTAVEYFLNAGFRNFAYCSFSNLEWSQIRAKYFAERLKAEGIEPALYEKPFLFLHKHWKREQEELADWLVSLPKPVAVMACNDERGKHVLEACKIAELVVPEQVAVLGVDNDETICELTQPPLSSISVNAEKAGYEAAEVLDRMMQGRPGPYENVVVQTLGVKARQSTDIFMIEDETVARALSYIRMNSKRFIQVDEVAEAAAIHRRGLERRFKKHLGRSVHEEIRRARLEEIKKLLLETNLLVSQIALRLNFSEVPHLTRFFTRETGTSPNEFRKQHLGNLKSL
ncbi:Xylose operon regulatory protein [Limihaloglobus sulfuriphilus]|uniref:Xylose operon regulatory protein n=1 Tax=Limihaloglobus sulfuriphilus TaxID=1851148 RepID=A0A1Q2MBI3_9BACT|nr:DNA-binding transcriptional regulator [Limihaloglobus sulfuriphilus]AQQ70041.1 Xylose operon regulatory protein [Limihaloglobus sulfuriphilus]